MTTVSRSRKAILTALYGDTGLGVGIPPCLGDLYCIQRPQRDCSKPFRLLYARPPYYFGGKQTSKVLQEGRCPVLSVSPLPVNRRALCRLGDTR